MVMRSEHAKGFAIVYFLLGLLLILTKDYEWELILAFGLLAIALIEFMGGEDNRKNWLFTAIFAVLALVILMGSAYQYWVLVITFIVWGLYEIVEERNLNNTRTDLVGVASVLIGILLLITGVIGNTYENLMALVFGIVFTIQGLKEWFK